MLYSNKEYTFYLLDMANYSTDDVFRILDEWIREGVIPYWNVDCFAGGILVHRAVLLEHGLRVQGEGKTQVEATIKAMALLRGYNPLSPP